MSSTFTLGIDLHGVADAFPTIVAPVLKFLRESGTKVIFISGPPAGEVFQQLSSLGYEEGCHYDLIVSVVDFIRSKDYAMWQDTQGNWWTDDAIWWSSKAKICEEYSVDVIIDDSPKYAPFFENIKTKFVLVNSSR